MQSESDIVKALAHEIANKITRKTISGLQRMPYDSPLSGDDSGLKTFGMKFVFRFNMNNPIIGIFTMKPLNHSLNTMYLS